MPLGLHSDSNYEKTQSNIAGGDQLTFILDGVVEATDLQGRLFGFERSRLVSKLFPNAIAGAAKEFGQEDDITIVTVTRFKAVEHTSETA